MPSTTSYEVLSLRQGKWEIEVITADKNEAINQANETLGTGHYKAVKVLAEKIDDETGESTTFTLLSKKDRRSGKPATFTGTDKRKVSESRNRKRKKPGNLADFLIKICLAIWAILATAAFLICSLAGN